MTQVPSLIASSLSEVIQKSYNFISVVTGAGREVRVYVQPAQLSQMTYDEHECKQCVYVCECL